MKKNNYQIGRETRYKKIKPLKKFFKSKSINIKNFEKNLNKYQRIHNNFMVWRKNFKYPELDYLKRLETIKPLPSDKLISDLAQSICELKKLFIELKNFKAGAIFKLFLNHISQCIKTKYKIKYASKGFLGVSPVSRDISQITDLIVEYFLNIRSEEDDPKANYSCGCKKIKGYKYFKLYEKNQFVCKKCNTYASRDPIKPWNEDPDSSIYFSSDGNKIEGKDYRKKLKEFKTLINKRHNSLVLEKNYFGGKPNKILVVEKLINLFFEINLFLEDGKIEFYLFNQPQKKELIKDTDRILLNKINFDRNNREEITLYWGEIKDDKPHGKGISEKYEIDDINRKIIKSLSPLWWKKYSRDLKAKDLVGHIITERYEGEWANGKKNGKGELITYYDPADVSNKDWTPQIYEKLKGIFKDDILFNGKSKGGGLAKIFRNGKEKII